MMRLRLFWRGNRGHSICLWITYTKICTNISIKKIHLTNILMELSFHSNMRPFWEEKLQEIQGNLSQIPIEKMFCLIIKISLLILKMNMSMNLKVIWVPKKSSISKKRSCQLEPSWLLFLKLSSFWYLWESFTERNWKNYLRREMIAWMNSSMIYDLKFFWKKFEGFIVLKNVYSYPNLFICL